MSRMRWSSLLGAVLVLLAACTTTDPGVVRGAATALDGPIPTSTDGTIEGFDPDQVVPDDPDVRSATLDNGLTYYVRENHSPGGFAELRLAIDAGSVLEGADQSAVAHFLEHMLFNGTEEYPGNELIKVLESFGAAFGADINAYTSYDETVYSLSVPTADGEVLDTAIDILQQWLSAATLTEDDVIAERGVVLDEWRQSVQSSSGRLFEAIAELFLAGSAYEGRDPIGEDAAIETMSAELLRRFYDQWYRPDNAALVIVGDIDVDDVERTIVERFGGLADRSDGALRPPVTFSPFGEPAARVVADPDVVSGFVELTLPAPRVGRDTPAAMQEDLFLSLAMQMIATRLDDDATRGEADHDAASVDSNSHVRALDAPSVLVEGDAAALPGALDAVLVEFERVERYGFDPVELARAVDARQAEVDADHDAAPTTQDVEYADRYVQAFLADEPYPAADLTYELAQALLDSASTELVAEALARRRSVAAPHLLISAPGGAALPTATEVLAMIDEIDDREIEPRPAAEAVDGELMTAPSPIEEIAEDQLTSEPGLFLEPTRLTFANGVQVVLNPTPIAGGTTFLGAYSQGGTSLVADADVPDAYVAPLVATTSGLGGLDPVEAAQVLGRTSVQLQPYLDTTSENWFGSASTTDLETMLQVLHLTMTEPRFDQNALDTVLGRLRPYAENPDTDPDVAGQIAFADARYGAEAGRFRPVPTSAELDTVDLDGIERVWRDRYGDAGDWVFVLAGDFDVDEASELARTYLGTLAGTGRVEQWVDAQPDAPAGVVARDVLAGTGERASLTVGWSQPATSTDQLAELTAEVLTAVLDSRLVDHIREELGATYSPRSYVSVLTDPDPLVESFVTITGAPDGMSEISTILQQDLAALRDDGPTDDELAAALEELGNNLDLISNEQLIDVLLEELTGGGGIDDLLSLGADAARIDASAVTDLARRALPADHYIQITVLPA